MNRAFRLAVLAAPLLAVAACGDPPAPLPAGEIIRGAPISGAPAATEGDGASEKPFAFPDVETAATPPSPGPAPPSIGDVTPPSETQRIDEPPVVPLVPPGTAGPTTGAPEAPPAEGGGAKPPAPPTDVAAKPPEVPAEGEKPAAKPADGVAAKEGKAAEGASAATARTLNFEFLASFEYLPPDPEVAGSDIKSLASIPEDVKKLDGTWATVEGYMLPLEYADDGVKAFLVSRHQMGCCFGVLPKPNELVEVEMPEGKIAPYVSYIPVLVTGKLRVGPKEGASTVLSGIYRIEEPSVDIREEDDETR